MKILIIYFGYISLLYLIGVNVKAQTVEPKLKIDITKNVECRRKTQNGDTLKIHYKGFLEDGTEFDNSSERSRHPFEFKIGVGNVIKGWDQGLLGMCVGEKRRLTIPPELAYGDSGFGGLIPPGSTIIFDTELLGINIRDEL